MGLLKKRTDLGDTLDCMSQSYLPKISSSRDFQVLQLHHRLKIPKEITKQVQKPAPLHQGVNSTTGVFDTFSVAVPSNPTAAVGLQSETLKQTALQLRETPQSLLVPGLSAFCSVIMSWFHLVPGTVFQGLSP